MRAAVAVVAVCAALVSCTDSSAEPAPETSATSPTISLDDSEPPAPPTGDDDVEPPPVTAVPCGHGAQSRVVGVDRRIFGDVFGRPLMSPPDPDRNNKILWSTRLIGRGDLVIVASLNGSESMVKRRVDGGPGPSIINVPKAGCWTFSMTWSGHHDAVGVRYLSPR